MSDPTRSTGVYLTPDEPLGEMLIPSWVELSAAWDFLDTSQFPEQLQELADDFQRTFAPGEGPVTGRLGLFHRTLIRAAEARSFRRVATIGRDVTAGGMMAGLSAAVRPNTHRKR